MYVYFSFRVQKFRIFTVPPKEQQALFPVCFIGTSNSAVKLRQTHLISAVLFIRTLGLYNKIDTSIPHLSLTSVSTQGQFSNESGYWET
jgi:hypothetical protein